MVCRICTILVSSAGLLTGLLFSGVLVPYRCLWWKISSNSFLKIETFSSGMMCLLFSKSHMLSDSEMAPFLGLIYALLCKRLYGKFQFRCVISISRSLEFWEGCWILMTITDFFCKSWTVSSSNSCSDRMVMESFFLDLAPCFVCLGWSSLDPVILLPTNSIYCYRFLSWRI